MRILHTSDWHIGRSLYEKRRYDEHAALLDWMAETLRSQRIDVLLIAGDVFDTSAPSHRAQELYYRFLCQAAGTGCRHVVVTAGNHDSPSFLDAPRELLRFLNVHVVGTAMAPPENEALVLRDSAGQAELIVCAVPYLRERDLRSVDAGESLEDKGRKVITGLREHYGQVCARAEQERRALGRPVPIVAMGHLFTAGGKKQDHDGVRDLYIGTLAHAPADIFPPCVDYLALGHLHAPQQVDRRETMRYSGAPLPMGFGEAGQEKSVCVVEFSAPDGPTVLPNAQDPLAPAPPTVRLVPVPVFQPLERIRGDLATIQQRLRALADTGEAIWIEVIYDGDAIQGGLRETLEAEVAESNLTLLRIQNQRVADQILETLEQETTIDELDGEAIFQRCLDAHKAPDAQRPELLALYRQVVAELQEQDALAE